MSHDGSEVIQKEKTITKKIHISIFSHLFLKVLLEFTLVSVIYFLVINIDGVALTLLLREDLIRMGITKLDQQLILMQSIDLLLTLVRFLFFDNLLNDIQSDFS